MSISFDREPLQMTCPLVLRPNGQSGASRVFMSDAQFDPAAGTPVGQPGSGDQCTGLHAAHRTVGQAKIGHRESRSLVAQHLGYAPKARPILRQTHPVAALLHTIRTCLDGRLAPPAGPLCHFMKPFLPHRSSCGKSRKNISQIFNCG